jgi:hypothetical protein
MKLATNAAHEQGGPWDYTVLHVHGTFVRATHAVTFFLDNVILNFQLFLVAAQGTNAIDELIG